MHPPSADKQMKAAKRFHPLEISPDVTTVISRRNERFFFSAV